MVKTLHILNGDASVAAFEAAALPGDVIVWREIMSEGPLVAQCKDDACWELRQEYIQQHYAETAEVYKAKVLDVLLQLRQLYGYKEVLLWFDTDLMCQINLLFLLNYIKPQHHQTLQMATPAHTPVSLLSVAEIQRTYSNRITLKPDDLALAHQLWQAYADESPLLLQEIVQGEMSPFQYLQEALALHFLRFPDCATGMNHVETLLLQHLDHGGSDKQSLRQLIWQTAPGYGYGDSQINLILQELSPALLHIIGEDVSITEAGRKVLRKQLHLSMLQGRNTYIGGVRLDEKNMDWCRDNEENRIRAGGKKLE
ncbi:DUF1835 domain-containing protein [Pontibacter beigongshangensis]|uniref:DUF1835 domain-containing protein n=1 Tax=Pontibacter beigongshangensis TaxID=2574733 RepID=UPI00164F39E4|nr:DUF1835 domain-containing protein [Pontibacter beigongshangensis]